MKENDQPKLCPDCGMMGCPTCSPTQSNEDIEILNDKMRDEVNNE